MTAADSISTDRQWLCKGTGMNRQNGQMMACGAQFAFEEVEVLTALVDLESVSSFRIHNKSFGY